MQSSPARNKIRQWFKRERREDSEHLGKEVVFAADDNVVGENAKAAVAAMKDVLIFRTDKAKRFFQVAKLEGARQIIRDLAWANGSMRGYDILATASKDGAIRIYELRTQTDDKNAAPGTASSSAPLSVSPRGHRQNAPSGIGAGLAGGRDDR